VAVLAFSLPLVASNLAGFVLNLGDRVVIQRDLGSVPVGRYQIAYNVGFFGVLLLTMLNAAWIPMCFAVPDDAERWELMAQLRDGSMRVVLPFIAAVCFGAPIALLLWAPSTYHPTHLVSITILVVVSTIPYAMFMSSSRVLLWFKLTGRVFRYSAIAAILNVILNLVLVPSYGILGSAIATFLCYGALGISTYLSATRLVRLRKPHVGFYAGALATVPVGVLGVILPTTTFGLMLRAALSVCCGAFLLIFGAELLGRKIPLALPGRRTYVARHRKTP
jgi:O-antigen/teichoic acid export membrane protein